MTIKTYIDSNDVHPISWTPDESEEEPEKEQQYIKVFCGKIIHLAHNKFSFFLPFHSFPYDFKHGVYVFDGIPAYPDSSNTENARFAYTRKIYTTEPFTVECLSASMPIMVEYLGDDDILSDADKHEKHTIYNVRGDVINGK